MSGEELKRDALAKLLFLMDTFAGEGLGHTYGNGQVIDADDVSLELCAAFGMEFDAGWWRSIPDQIFAHPLPEQPQEGEEREVMFEVWQDDMMVASSTDEADAIHYLAVYAQDGPAKLMRAETVRTTLATETKESGDA